MKILMALMGLNIGGAETHVLELSKELCRMGHEIVVASAGGVFVKELEDSGVRHIYVPLNTKSPVAVIKSYFSLKKLIQNEDFDVVHAHARIPAFILGFLQRKMHFRFVTTAHLNFRVNPLFRLFSNWGDRTLAVSEDIKEYLIQEYNVPEEHISLTINGIDSQKFSSEVDFSHILNEFSLHPEKRHIVYISRIDNDRSLPAFQLADIASELYRFAPDTEIIIVGGGNDIERLREKCAAVNAAIGENYITLTGARTDINAFIAASDIFVGVSRSALEAMSAAKPVILSGDQGYLGIFEESKINTAIATNFCCRDCEPPKKETLLSDIELLLSKSKDELSSMGVYNQSVIADFYSVHRMAQDYEKVYKSVCHLSYYRFGEVILSGYYGFDNMGDETLLSCIIRNLRTVDPEITITVLTKHCAKVRRQFNVAAVNRYRIFKIYRAMRHAKLFISGGGNLLQNSTSKRSLYYYLFFMRLSEIMKLKSMFYANGIGPISGEKDRHMVKNILEKTDVITLREEESLRFVRSMNLKNPNVFLTADPVFCSSYIDDAWICRLRKHFSIDPQKHYYAVSLRKFKSNRTENIQKMASVCREIYHQYGYLPIFVPMQPKKDEKTCRAVAKAAGFAYQQITGISGDETMGLIGGMEFVLSMRLHALMYACVSETVPIGVVYDSKVKAFIDTLDIPMVLDNSWTVEDALTCIHIAVLQKAELQKKIREACKKNAESASFDAKMAVRLLREGTVS